MQIRQDDSFSTAPNATRTLWRDAAGRVRQYAISGGSEDQALTVTEDCTPEAFLTFALIEAGATKGTTGETCVCLGPVGNVLRADEHCVKRPCFAPHSFGPG